MTGFLLFLPLLVHPHLLAPHLDPPPPHPNVALRPLTSVALSSSVIVPTSTPSCTSDTEHLCLHGGRFRVATAWATPGGTTGNGKAVQITADTGYFWFFDSPNVELVIKVINGCTLNR